MGDWDGVALGHEGEYTDVEELSVRIMASAGE
jgi:hypothetical protein